MRNTSYIANSNTYDINQCHVPCVLLCSYGMCVILINFHLSLIVRNFVTRTRAESLSTNKMLCLWTSAWYIIIPRACVWCKYCYCLGSEQMDTCKYGIHHIQYTAVHTAKNRILSLIARFMGPTWGSSGADRTQVGPMLAPWILLSGIFLAFQRFPWNDLSFRLRGQMPFVISN